MLFSALPLMVFTMNSTQPTEFELDDDLRNTDVITKPPPLHELSPQEIQLHDEIKARATIPTGFKKLPRSDPLRPFELRLPLDFIEHFGLQPDPIHYFKLFFTDAIIHTILQNTNAYALSKKPRLARHSPSH
jgi:hypothetical protein